MTYKDAENNLLKVSLSHNLIRRLERGFLGGKIP